MTGGEGRLNKLYPSLSAKERAKLVLSGLKEDTEEDPLVRSKMPSDQAYEFNRLIHLMNGVNLRLAPLVLLIHEGLATVSQRLGWLSTLRVFEDTANLVALFLFVHVKEPVTESEYAKAREKTEREWIPLQELAEMEADGHDEWKPEDLLVEDGEELITWEAWDRVKAYNAAQLRKLARQGTLKGRRSRGGLRIQASSYYGWKGEEVPVRPDRCLHYEIVPDSQRSEARRLRQEQRDLLEALRPFDARVPSEEDGEGAGMDRLGGILKAKIIEALQHYHPHLQAVAKIIDEVAEQFDGEDPCQPEVRDLLRRTEEELSACCEQAASMLEPFELPEAGEEEIEGTRRLLLRDPFYGGG